MGRVPESDRLEVRRRRVDLEQRHVVRWVGAHKGRRERRRLVVEGHGDRRGALDDVVVRHHLSRGGNDHPGPLVL